MARLLLPAVWTQQPTQSVELAPAYKASAELCFLANAEYLRNLGKTLPGKVLTKSAYAKSKSNAFGRGIYTSDSANPAFQDATWPLPVTAGSGDFSCIFAVQPSAGPSAHSQHLILNSSGGFNACFYVVINGYIANAGNAFTNESGTLWCGTYYGDSTQNARGVKKAGVVNGSPVTGVYNRFKDGRHELWLNGVLVDSYSSAYVMPFAAGTHTVRVNSYYGSVSLVADLDRCLPAAEAAAISSNPWAIFSPLPRRALVVPAAGGANVEVTPDGFSTPAPDVGTTGITIDTATNVEVTPTGIISGTPTVGTTGVVLAPILAASRAYVQNLQTGEVYYTKGLTTGETKPASMVKLMTALLLVEAKPTKSELMAQSVTMLVDAINEGTSATFQTGDVTNLYDLLAMAQLPSDNASAAMIGYVIGKESLGGTPTYAQAKTEFVALMNARATALGMTDTTYVNAHGLDNNASSPKDTNIVLAALAKNKILRDIWRFSSWVLTVTRASTPTTLQSPAAYGNGYPGMIGGKGGSLTGLYNRGILWEAPNGHLIALTTMGSPTYNDLSADSAAIIANLTIDYPELATPDTAFTPDYAFSTFSFGGAYWDASDASTMWQDSAGTIPVTGAGQPVGKWVPKAGDSSLYFRQTTDSKRPMFDGSKIVFDGTDDYLDLGVESFGNTGLFANSGERFMVLQKFASSGATGTLIAKAGATQAARTFHSYVDSTVGAEPGLWMRGSQTYADNNLADGSPHTMNVWWDGERGGMGRIDQGSKHVLLGAATEESQNIILGARTGGTGAFLNGSVQHIVLADSYDNDIYRRMRDWSNGATVNAFPYSSGMVNEEVEPLGITSSAPDVGAIGVQVYVNQEVEPLGFTSSTPDVGTFSIEVQVDNVAVTSLGFDAGAPDVGPLGVVVDCAVTPLGVVAGTPDVGVFSISVSSGVWPQAADVRLGITYGPTGTEYTGTLTGGTGATAEQIAAAVWSRVIATGLTAEQLQRVLLAGIAGKTQGIGSNTEKYMAEDGVTPRITATFDSAGNRASIVLNGD